VVDGLWQLLETNDGRRAVPRLLRYMAERRKQRARWVGALEQADIPMALVNGSADPVSGAHLVARWRELGIRGGVTALPGIGHYPQLEAPDAVLAASLAFWRQAGITG
jgi:pimeloyl-ACP methyl ester carboxylesterase